MSTEQTAELGTAQGFLCTRDISQHQSDLETAIYREVYLWLKFKHIPVAVRLQGPLEQGMLPVKRRKPSLVCVGTGVSCHTQLWGSGSASQTVLCLLPRPLPQPLWTVTHITWAQSIPAPAVCT